MNSFPLPYNLVWGCSYYTHFPHAETGPWELKADSRGYVVEPGVDLGGLLPETRLSPLRPAAFPRRLRHEDHVVWGQRKRGLSSTCC